MRLSTVRPVRAAVPCSSLTTQRLTCARRRRHRQLPLWQLQAVGMDSSVTVTAWARAVGMGSTVCKCRPTLTLLPCARRLPTCHRRVTQCFGPLLVVALEAWRRSSTAVLAALQLVLGRRVHHPLTLSFKALALPAATVHLSSRPICQPPLVYHRIPQGAVVQEARRHNSTTVLAAVQLGLGRRVHPLTLSFKALALPAVSVHLSSRPICQPPLVYHRVPQGAVVQEAQRHSSTTVLAAVQLILGRRVDTLTCQYLAPGLSILLLRDREVDAVIHLNADFGNLPLLQMTITHRHSHCRIALTFTPSPLRSFDFASAFAQCFHSNLCPCRYRCLHPCHLPLTF